MDRQRHRAAVVGYEPSLPRGALGVIAAAMAAITTGTLVVLPAKFDSLGADPCTLVKARNGAIEVAIIPSQIDVREAVDRGKHIHPGRMTLAAHDSAVNRAIGIRILAKEIP